MGKTRLQQKCQRLVRPTRNVPTSIQILQLNLCEYFSFILLHKLPYLKTIEVNKSHRWRSRRYNNPTKIPNCLFRKPAFPQDPASMKGENFARNYRKSPIRASRGKKRTPARGNALRNLKSQAEENHARAPFRRRTISRGRRKARRSDCETDPWRSCASPGGLKIRQVVTSLVKRGRKVRGLECREISMRARSIILGIRGQ